VHFEGDILELDAEVFRDDLAAGQDGDVFQLGLAAVAEAGGLEGGARRPPRSLLTTSVAKASPSMSSVMISRGRLTRESRMCPRLSDIPRIRPPPPTASQGGEENASQKPASNGLAAQSGRPTPDRSIGYSSA
jgi:hypothetical protein